MERLQRAIKQTNEDRKNECKEKQKKEAFAKEFDPETTHDIWDESSDLEDDTIEEFTARMAMLSDRGEMPSYVNTLLESLKNRKEELPWNLYLNRLMGSINSSKKKTITRRNRRQPHRLDLRGELRNHKAEVAVAIDISGSISDE